MLGAHLIRHVVQLVAVPVLTACVRPVTGVLMGDVYTSATAIARLAVAEERVVNVLTDYLQQQEQQLDRIRNYVKSWQGSASGHSSNPLSSYHLLRRLTLEYDTVLQALNDTDVEDVKHNLFSAKEGLLLPSELDLNGAAYSLVKLQNIYNLDFDELIEGRVLDSQAAAPLTADDCLRFGHQSFINLEFQLSDKWTRKGLELLKTQEIANSEIFKKISEVELILKKRKTMRSLVEKLAKETSEDVLDRFSGLGIPGSFQKTLYSMRDGSEHVDMMANNYEELCRGNAIRPDQLLESFDCGYIFPNDHYGPLMPFKVELLWSDPVIMLYHDVISDHEIEVVKKLAEPDLETTQVHSFVTHRKMKSLARVGKTAWLQRSRNKDIVALLRRIEDMTGLVTDTAEDLHVLNYGIAGHYDMHVDFFDLMNKNMSGRLDGGDRMATALFYLNDVEAGGATVFPVIGLQVPAKKGTALFWFNLSRSGAGDYRTAHASCPVLLGEKWIANLWIRETGQEFRWPCSLNKDE